MLGLDRHFRIRMIPFLFFSFLVCCWFIFIYCWIIHKSTKDDDDAAEITQHCASPRHPTTTTCNSFRCCCLFSSWPCTLHTASVRAEGGADIIHHHIIPHFFPIGVSAERRVVLPLVPTRPSTVSIYDSRVATCCCVAVRVQPPSMRQTTASWIAKGEWRVVTWDRLGSVPSAFSRGRPCLESWNSIHQPTQQSLQSASPRWPIECSRRKEITAVIQHSAARHNGLSLKN